MWVLLKRREFTPEIAAKSVHLFSVRSITGAYLLPDLWFGVARAFTAARIRPGAALLTVWLKEFTGDEIKIEIIKARGQPVANLKAPGAPGFTRLNWDLRPPKTSVSSMVVTIQSDCCLPGRTLSYRLIAQCRRPTDLESVAQTGNWRGLTKAITLSS